MQNWAYTLVVISPGGRYFAARNEKGAIRVCQLAGGEIKYYQHAQHGQVHTKDKVIMTPLITGAADNTVKVWHLKNI